MPVTMLPAIVLLVGVSVADMVMIIIAMTMVRSWHQPRARTRPAAPQRAPRHLAACGGMQVTGALHLPAATSTMITYCYSVKSDRLDIKLMLLC